MGVPTFGGQNRPKEWKRMKTVPRLGIATILSLLTTSVVAAPALAVPLVETVSCTTGSIRVVDHVIETGVNCGGSAVIPNTVTSIGDWAFSYAGSLTSVTFQAGSTVTSIPENAFYEAESLVTITIPNSVTSIGVNAFYLASALTTVTFEADSALYRIRPGAFFGARSLESITIPNNVTLIDSGAFFNCSTLATVTFDGVAPTVGASAFRNVAVGAKAIVSPSFVDSFGADPIWNLLMLPHIQSATPAPTPASAPYYGALPTKYSDRTPSIGDEVTISGERLDQVTSCTIDGVDVQLSSNSAGSFIIVIPEGLEPGLKDLVMFGAFGKLTAQDAFTVEANTTESPNVTEKTNAGSFNGYVAVYAKGHNGKTLTWKIAGKWFKTTITSDYQVFQRRTAAVGLDVDVHLFIDGEKQLTKTIATR
jgi:hypothetical protein